ncbi:hypothetical protein [Candidatus Sulfurimonas baltica]|uniref:Thioredoxin-like fold domain-containing protein n=1 Tax=Candidatus Sulfurimonas baltica TaxID=2740404 RepID=A0A7S7LWU9_9BACT|nr:hypothetical protein [Candidatus Sulfurimonas baltica]QOY52338.1 hypothetical protein HUE88_01190 [Candidatus Sulfurimonas baltica]
MKKIILFITLLFFSSSLSAIEEIKSMSQLKEHKLILLAFEKNGCPWCVRYKNVLNSESIKKYQTDVKFFKAQKWSEVFKKFTKKFDKKIVIYPMTYIIELDQNNESKIVHEIYGYQTVEYLEDLFTNELLLK